MRRWTNENELLTTEEAFDRLTAEYLKPLAKLFVNRLPTRKGELVAIIVGHLRNPEEVRALYEQLPALARQAVQEATHDLCGQFHPQRFEAKYGALPQFSEPVPAEDRYSSSYSYHRNYPTRLFLFFPDHQTLPTDLRAILETFVPPPQEYQLPVRAELPATFELARRTWTGRGQAVEVEEIPLRVRLTAREAEHDVKAVLRLIDVGTVRVTDKKRQPTAAAMKAVAGVLQGGDFYTEEDQGEYSHDPSSDLAIKPFAWPMIVQAAGFARVAGGRLELTPAGRKALTHPAHETLNTAWKKWRTSTLLDEYNRVSAIKGQAKAALAAVSQRRKAVIDGLAACPANQWFAVDDFFRFLRATDRDFPVANRTYKLYFAEHHYGNLGYEGEFYWELLQGRYILALLFEYAATLGLVDVAYVPPQGVRRDYQDRWGTDDYTCISRYDGLRFVRINPLGAWCLGLAEKYEAPAWDTAAVVKVLPNLDVVATSPPLAAADRLLLERYAEPQSEGVWKLTPAKVLTAVEEGMPLEELGDFLAARGGAPLPQTVQVFLDDMKGRAGQLRDLGLARLLECADAAVARQLAGDPQLRERCRLAGESWLVFRAGDETAVRRALRRLGYVLPPARE